MKLNGNASAKGKGFRKGTSGNPGGRPRGVAALVRAHTKDGTELVNLMMRVMRGKLLIEGKPPQHKDRMAACEWLADRGWGKAPDTVELPAPDTSILVSPEIIAGARAIAEKQMNGWQP